VVLAVAAAVLTAWALLAWALWRPGWSALTWDDFVRVAFAQRWAAKPFMPSGIWLPLQTWVYGTAFALTGDRFADNPMLLAAVLNSLAAAGAAALVGHAAGEPCLGLVHEPEGAPDLIDGGADLVLSGHTHGGQVVFPFVGALSRHSRICGRHTASGWIPNPYFPLYVTTGVGVAIPVRAWCRGEVLIVRLKGNRRQETGNR